MQNRPQNGFFSAWCRMQDAECRMQNQTQIVCPLGAAHSFDRILHAASASCIQGIGCKASGFGPDSAFCILHSASSMMSCVVPGHKRQRYGTIVYTLERRLRTITS